MLGDFNFPGIEWEQFLPVSHTTQIENEFCEFTNSQQLIQLVSQGTRGKNILDLVFTNTHNLIHKLEIAPPFSTSDHTSIIFELEQIITYEPTKYIKDFKKADYKTINQYLASIDWITIFGHSNDININYKNFSDIINETINFFIPCLTIENKLKGLPTHIKKLLDTQEGLWKRNIHKTNRPNYLKVTHLIRKQMLKFRKNKEKRIIPHPKKKFAYVGAFLKSKNLKYSTMVDDHNNIIFTNKQKVNILASHFSSVFKNSGTNTQITNKTSPLLNTIDYMDFSVYDIFNYLTKLDNKNNTSPDNIPNIFLKNCAQTLAYPLFSLFSLSLMTKKVSDLWKESIIVPIQKIPKAKKSNDFRPISLLCSTAKILEKILASKLVEHARKNRIFPQEQHGYHMGRSVTTQLLEVMDDLTMALENKKSVDIIYFDLSKAFDTISHERLLSKLKLLNIPDTLTKWLKHYLSNRTFSVKIHESFSEKMLIKSGVPQGSLLGPILFLYYIHDLTEFCYTENVTVKLYVDDIKAYYIFKDNPVNSNPLQEFIEKFSEYTEINGLDIAIKKCNILHLGTKNPRTIYTIEDTHITEIGRNQTVRDLGIFFDHELKFHNHIDIICNKARRISYTILRSLKSNDERFLINMFTTYVRSILEFSSPVWNPYYKKYINKIEKIQKDFVRMVYNRKHNIRLNERIPNYSELLRLYHIDSLENRRIITDLKIFHKHCIGLSPININNPYFIIPSKTRGDENKISHKACTSITRHNSFFVRTIRYYNKLPAYFRKLDYKNFAKNITHINFSRNSEAELS
uniref:Reverse transcriptase domain-containing protein n=1 Tax=Meloidogyne enterolobii TaxID=390850 RepID=A0A6V7X2Y7_MELEN|nr:unnamed protein product [Meloidogyne enterolobii]